MKRATLIGLSVATVAGGAALLLMNNIVNKPAPAKKVEVQVDATEVLVARTEIGLGEIANESQFRWQTWPKEAVSPSFITKAQGVGKMRDLSGAIARAPILAGEPITPHKLIKAGQGGVLSAILPAGMRAISTKIKEETAAGRLILPNDRVDVILIRRLRSRSGGEDYVSDTLFRNVRVLALGQQIETKEGKKTADSSANTATLELDSRQAELLALANSMGEISLSLRSVADLNAGVDGPTSGDSLNKERAGSIRVLRYGVKSRAYGVN